MSHRMRRNDDGFTLIELMVVVLIIAILIAVAVPTFLGARERAQDRAVQANLRNGVTAAAVLLAEQGDYAGTLTDYENTEPSLDFVASGTALVPGNMVGLNLNADNSIVTLAAASDSGDCFFIQRASGNTVATNYLRFASWAQSAAQPCNAGNTAGLTWSNDGW